MKTIRVVSRSAGTVVSSIALCLIICSTEAHAAGLGGTWSGQITQSDSGTYPVDMHLYGNIGNIDYRSLGCGGNLAYLRTDGKTFWYREHITYGVKKCIDGGIIQMHTLPFGDPTSWDWRWDGGGVTVRGVLHGSGVRQSQ